MMYLLHFIVLAFGAVTHRSLPCIMLFYCGLKVTCPACKGRGLVICRNCFSLYGEDPADIQAIREKMRRMPD